MNIAVRKSDGPGEVSSYRIWNESISDYTGSKAIIVQEGAFAFTFSNVGDTMARINGILLFPSTTPLLTRGDSITIGAHVLDVYKGNINLSFDVAPSLYPVGVAPHIQVIQLFYAKY
jgi:hypothetical protein